MGVRLGHDVQQASCVTNLRTRDALGRLVRPSLYDHTLEPVGTSVVLDRTVARYALERLLNQAGPQPAHSEAIDALRSALGLPT